MASYTQQHPLSFLLRDPISGKEVLQSGGTSAHPVNLEIRNVSGHSIELTTPSRKGGYHFELRFKAGDITKSGLESATQNLTEWKAEARELNDRKNKGAVSLYLTHTQNRATIKDDGNLTISLPNLPLLPGIESPIQVLFAYENIQYENGSKLAGKITAQLAIDIQHMGYSYLPIHIGLAGSNTLLNDGHSKHDLEIHLTNVGRGTIRFDNKTRFILHFDVSDERFSWAMGNATTLGSIQAVTLSLGNNSGPMTDPTQGQSNLKSWQFSNTKEVLTELKKSEQIIIKVKDLSTDYPAGMSNLYVEYEMIPGFEDGKLILPLEKSPLVIRRGVENVGLGFENPLAKLAVNGGVNIGGEEDPGPKNLKVAGTITAVQKITAENGMTVKGDTGLSVTGATNLAGLTVVGATDLQSLKVKGTMNLGGLTVNGDLNITGKLKVDNSAPFVFQTYTKSFPKDEKYAIEQKIETDFKVSEYVVCVVGFSGGADWDVQGVRVMPIAPKGSGAKWYIAADLKLEDDISWSISVLAIKKELVDPINAFSGSKGY